jgi:tetratricopeptide (TPR) repeat protein
MEQRRSRNVPGRGRDTKVIVTVRSTAGFSLLAWVLIIVLSAGRASAGNAEESHAYRDRATAAFALGNHAEAAEWFEKAFQLTPDPALLYNAAQAHRMAGNKERALLLYQNYARVFGMGERRAELQAHIDELTKAIAHDKEQAAHAPPPKPAAEAASGPAVKGGGTAVSSSGPAHQPPHAAVPGSKDPVLLSAPGSGPGPGDRDDRGRDESIVKKPWFWVATGGGVAAAVAVALALTLGGASDPKATIARIPGN